MFGVEKAITSGPNSLQVMGAAPCVSLSGKGKGFDLYA